MDTLTTNNPFLAQVPVPPSHFIGRDSEVRAILEPLANPLNRAGSAIAGVRGFGKTSLLHYLQSPQVLKDWHHLDSDVARFVFIPNYFIVPFTELSFWLYIFQDVQEWLQGTYREKVDPLANELAAGRLPSIHALTSFFTELGEERDSFVIALIDNFDSLFGAMQGSNWQENVSFLHKLRGLMNLPAPRGFSLVISSESHLFDLFRDVQWFGSDFFSNMSLLKLGPFAQREATELMSSYLAPTQVSFTLEEMDRLYESSEGNPHRLQELASDLFNKKKDRLPETLDVYGVGEKLNIAELQPEVANLITEATDKLFFEAHRVQWLKDTQADIWRDITEEEMRDCKLSTPTQDQQDELKHRIDMLNIHRRNVRLVEIQIAQHGGERNSPLDVINQLKEAENEIIGHFRALICALQRIYGRSIQVIRPGDNHPLSC